MGKCHFPGIMQTKLMINQKEPCQCNSQKCEQTFFLLVSKKAFEKIDTCIYVPIPCIQRN